VPDDFATTSGGSQTLLVAAGQLPFVVADPQLSGSSAVLYPQSAGGIYSANPVQPTFTVSCTMDAALPANKTKFYNPLVINWSYTIGTATTFIGITSHQVYVTLAPALQYTDPSYQQLRPPSTSKVYRSALNFAVSKDGATNQTTAFLNTWNQFTTGSGPANITAWDGQAGGRPFRVLDLHSTFRISDAPSFALFAKGGSRDVWNNSLRSR
jgi:hypothetical protein